MKPATFLQFAICFAFFQLARLDVVAQAYVPDTSFWETKASMNQNRTYFPAAAANGKIYAFGGIINNAGGLFTYTDKIEQYDPDADVWSVAGTLPQPMAGMAVVDLSGAAYIIGGVTDGLGNATSKVYRYFPETGTFDADTIASLPAPRAFLSACSAGRKIYAIGGATEFLGAVHNEVYVYDPNLNSWSTLQIGLTTARAAHTAVVVENKIYVIGGTTVWSNSLNSVEVYDFVASAWIGGGEPLSQARAAHGSAVLSDIIYALGGIESLTSAEMSVEAYGPEIPGGDSWEVFTNLAFNRRAFGCVAWPTDTLSYIYIMGGNSGSDVLANTQRLVIATTVGIDEQVPASPGNTNAMLSNFPNPFGQNTTISYTLGKSANIVISIFDATGQLISIPVNGPQTPGKHDVPFDGSRLEPGVYFCVMKSHDGAGYIWKMIVMR